MPIFSSDHPEICPRGYQWLPDIVEELGAQETLEPIREALAEGDIKAMLETPFRAQQVKRLALRRGQQPGP